MPTVTGYATDFITFSRASNATVTDSNGYIKWAAHNLLTNSESFDAASWSRQGLSGVTANAIASPNGTTTADKLLETNLNDFHYIAQLNVIDDSAPVSTLSVFAKAAERQYLNLALAWGANFVAATFDLTGGTVTSDRSGGTGASQSSSITSVGGGWYLCTLRGTIGTGGSDAAIIAISDSATPTGAYPQYTGTTGNGFYVWGAHLYRSDLGGMVANTSAYPYYNPTTPKNLLGYTEDFSNAAWTKANTTVTANSTNSPNGLITADLITASAGAAQHYVQAGVTYTVNTPYSISVYAKAGTYNLIQIGLNSQNVFANFNVSTGVVGSNSGTTSTAITSVGDGWYRCSVGFTNTAGANLVISLISASTDSRIPSWTATGSETVYLWGAQLSDSASLDTYVPNYFAAPTAAAYYGPRLDYDPSTLAAKGLLVEEQRTNLMLRSQEFDNAGVWFLDAATVSANATAAPDGTTTADKLVENSATATHDIYQSLSSQSAGSYTYSIYAKASGRTKFRLQQTATTAYAVLFDLTALTATTVAGGATGVITNAGNGWYRCSMTYTTVAAFAPTLVVFLANDAGSISYAGDGTSGLFLYGAQTEAGSFATSYIPTTSASVTRSADVAQVSTQAFPYNATEGTWVASVQRLSSTFTSYAFETTQSSSSMRVRLGTDARMQSVDLGSVQVDEQLAVSVPTGVTKYAMAYKANDYAGSANGATVVTDTSATVPALSTLNIGSASVLNIYIRQITYIPRRLTNAELQSRTT